MKNCEKESISSGENSLNKCLLTAKCKYIPRGGGKTICLQNSEEGVDIMARRRVVSESRGKEHEWSKSLHPVRICTLRMVILSLYNGSNGCEKERQVEQEESGGEIIRRFLYILRQNGVLP